MLREVSSVIHYSVKIIRRSQFRGPMSSRALTWLAKFQPALDSPLAMPVRKLCSAGSGQLRYIHSY
jgi:hypothetical protein